VEGGEHLQQENSSSEMFLRQEDVPDRAAARSQREEKVQAV